MGQQNLVPAANAPPAARHEHVLTIPPDTKAGETAVQPAHSRARRILHRRGGCHRRRPVVAGGRREKIGMSKIFVGISLGAIFAAYSNNGGPGPRARAGQLEFAAQWVAILLMMVGIYVRGKLPGVSRVVQRVGELICLVGLFFMQAPITQLRTPFVWFLSALLASLVATAMFYGELS